MLLQRRGHVVTPDVLLDLVWGDAAAELTASTVHTVVARLRRALGSDVIETHDAGYRLGRQVRLDSDDFDAALRRAREATAAGDAAGAVTAYRLRQALVAGSSSSGVLEGVAQLAEQALVGRRHPPDRTFLATQLGQLTQQVLLALGEPGRSLDVGMDDEVAAAGAAQVGMVVGSSLPAGRLVPNATLVRLRVGT